MQCFGKNSKKLIIQYLRLQESNSEINRGFTVIIKNIICDTTYEFVKLMRQKKVEFGKILVSLENVISYIIGKRKSANESFRSLKTIRDIHRYYSQAAVWGTH